MFAVGGEMVVADGMGAVSDADGEVLHLLVGDCLEGGELGSEGAPVLGGGGDCSREETAGLRARGRGGVRVRREMRRAVGVQ